MRDESNSAGDQLRSAREYGADLARRVEAEYRTNDVFKLAALAGVRVEYGRWPPVTVGEFEPRTSTISINLAAVERALGSDESRAPSWTLVRVIVAHELGHFFAARFGRKPSRVGKGQGRPAGRRGAHSFAEQCAHGFAGELLRLPFAAEECERLWRN